MRIGSTMTRALPAFAVTFALCAGLPACGAKAKPKPKPAPKPARPMSMKAPAPFTETIAGTLTKFDMVGIPGGEIAVAYPTKPGTTRKVKIRPFWIGKTEVTWDEYDVFVFRLDEPKGGVPDGKDAVSRPSKPYGAADRGYGHKGYPAINLSYHGAESYCKWLTLKTGHKYRLPTEAEWEYACRAGAPELIKEQLSDHAWFWQEKTQAVGQKKPNAWGAIDMLGNVAEWCTDLTGKPVVCGGSWGDMAKGITPAARQYQDESWQANDPQNPKSKWWLSDASHVGFRVLREE